MNLQKIRPEYDYLKKKLSLFREVAIFSIIIVSKVGFIGTEKYLSLPGFCLTTTFMSYVNCESAKDLDRI